MHTQTGNRDQYSLSLTICLSVKSSTVDPLRIIEERGPRLVHVCKIDACSN